MLSENDKEHIKLLYDKFLKINQYIRTSIENIDMETIENIFNTKNQLIKQIVSFEKIYHKEIKEDKELLALKLDLIEKEKENIVLMEELKEKLTQEFSKAGKMKKIYSAYEPSLNEVRSTFEVNNED